MVKKIKIDFKEISEEAIKNAREDREKTTALLGDMLTYVQGGGDRVADVGLILAKYMETLQRSNEQLVKVAALARKDEVLKSDKLSEEDREAIFDELNKGN